MKAVVYWISVMMIAAAVGLGAAAAPATFGFSRMIVDIAFVVVMSVVLAYAGFSFWQYARALRDEMDDE